MINGLFVNSGKANCSIYESGLMIFNAIKSDKYKLDYIELAGEQKLEPYDFYIINWHHWVLPLKRDFIRKLPGLKIGIVLEMSESTIFDPLPPNIFDVHMVIDPTLKKTNLIYPFPRPLETIDNIKPLLREDIPVIGSFGFLTGGKNFEEIVQVCNASNSPCIVRINIPYGTHAGASVEKINNYGKLLKSLAEPNVEVRFTTNYMSKYDLVGWLSENTINSFPYYRNQPGLAAVTDQAITAGRAIAITNNSTFRHMLKYISYYPKESYWSLLYSTIPGIKKMQEDWHPSKFKEKFEELLTERKIL